jgi:FixJ family two-component response regulator
MISRRILFVDDEPKILQGFERQFGGRFDLRTVPGPVLGLQILVKDGPYAAVVSDYRMPMMNGVEFLAKARQRCPDTVRVMLTGQADLNAAIHAVNEGAIFRFLSKPCSTEVLSAALDSALEQYRLTQAERELLERTLHGSIKIMTEVLSMTSPAAFSRACRVRRYVAHVVSRLALPDAWQFEIAAMLCQLGCLTVPAEVLDKVAVGGDLSAGEQEVFAAHPKVAERLLENIPRLERVARMIGNQEVSSTPARKAEEDDLTALGTTLLRTSLEFDRLLGTGVSRDAALAQMRSKDPHAARFLEALEDVEIEHVESEVRSLNLSELRASMIMNQDVVTDNGVLLLAKGEELTLPLIARLQNFAKTWGIPQPLSVRLPRVSSEAPPH